MAEFEVYTDGACSGNPGGPGGWAAVVTGPDETIWYAGYGGRTTNNRMELMAAIKGLEHTPPGSHVTLYSDSQYLVNTMTKNWRRQKNHDLWEQLDSLSGTRRLNWQWVRGHAGYPLNEAADRLAVAAAAGASYGEQSGTFEGATPVAQAPPPAPAQARAPVPPVAPGQARAPVPHGLSHLDEHGRARMVDVSAKVETAREATARGAIYMEPSTLDLILGGEVPKGDVFTVAQIAGVMAAKKTSELVPLCHPLPLTQVRLEFEADRGRSCVDISATVRTSAQTGVEMEALTAVSVAALTIYDMCKAVDRAMRIADVRVVFKAGGKTGTFQQQ